MERYREIERSITKTYRKDLWGRFVKAVDKYKLIEEGDRIAVCLSGGKDSMLLAKLMQIYHMYGEVNFDLEFITMNPGYDDDNIKSIKKNTDILNIPLNMFDTNIFDAVDEITNQSPCFICGRMRRGYLYRRAKEIGCNKIALGHHYDDVIETILMSMLYGAQIQTMLPKLKSTNVEGMELIRPMYLIREQDVLAWGHYNQLDFIKCACKATKNIDNKEFATKRAEVKQLIADLREKNALVENNIFSSVENVNLRKIMSYQKDGVRRNFLDDYDD